MKKILAAVAATALVFGAAGCSSDSADNGSNGASQVQKESQKVENAALTVHDAAGRTVEFEEKLYALNPAAKDLPEIGNIAKGDVTVENLLAQDSDVVVMSPDHKDDAEKTGFLDDLD